MDIQKKDLGCITNIDVINQFVSLHGRFVIDAGCGDMAVARQLADHATRVLAIDPDPVQAELNRADPLVGSSNSNVDFVEIGADQVPVEDRTVDGIFFSYSLHHIPADIYPRVFAEVLRVLRSDGFLYVIEPIDCPLNDVMKLFHNEDVERAVAQQALVEFAIPFFQSVDVVSYHSYSQYESFEQFADHFSNRSFNSIYTREDVYHPKVREAFEQLGGSDHRFQSPKQVMCLQGLKDDDDQGALNPHVNG